MIQGYPLGRAAGRLRPGFHQAKETNAGWEAGKERPEQASCPCSMELDQGARGFSPFGLSASDEGDAGNKWEIVVLPNIP
jgi:hypothetical protein